MGALSSPAAELNWLHLHTGRQILHHWSAGVPMPVFLVELWCSVSLQNRMGMGQTRILLDKALGLQQLDRNSSVGGTGMSPSPGLPMLSSRTYGVTDPVLRGRWVEPGMGASGSIASMNPGQACSHHLPTRTVPTRSSTWVALHTGALVSAPASRISWFLP